MSRISWLIILSVLIAAPATAQRVAHGESSANTENLGSGIYSVNWGVMGLNVGASVGDDGIILIDDQDEPSVPRLQAELAKISVKPVRIVINSHWHFDHVGGNKIYAMEGAIIIAHANTRTRLMIDQINPANGGKQRAFPPAFWPQVTFEDSLTLRLNGDDIDITHVKNAHTDGDVIVRFRKANVLFAADLFNNGDYTRIDARGGSLEGMIAAYRMLLPALDDKTKVVPGRGQVGTKKDLEEYLQVMIALRDRIGQLVTEGKTLQETIAAKPTHDLDVHWGNGPIKPADIVAEVYADLKRTAR